MRLTTLADLGLRPLTLASLHRGGINTLWWLMSHCCRELIWHREIPPSQLHEILCRLDRYGLALKPTANSVKQRPPGARNLEVFRLRVVEGRTLREVAAQTGITTERVRQVLSSYFGLHGEPPAVKRRPCGARPTPYDRRSTSKRA